MINELEVNTKYSNSLVNKVISNVNKVKVYIRL